MRRIAAMIIACIASAIAPAFFASAQQAEIAPKKVLSVPYISEVPDGRWVGSWKNACEEASIAMADRYYAGVAKPTVAWQKKYMSGLFAIERKLWKSDANTDAAMTAQLINDNSSFGASVKEDPSIDEIKAELDAGRPVIAPVDGFKLANKNIPFLAAGSGYHMLIIIGYDDGEDAFVVHDNGDLKSGAGILYGYDRLMGVLHDYSFARKKTDGPARAIFTYPKLAKTAASHRIYYLHDGVKRYVSHPAVFSKKGWSWSWVNVVDADYLAGFEDGEVVKP